MGDGERPRRWNVVALREGEFAACDPENDDLLEPGLVEGGSIS